MLIAMVNEIYFGSDVRGGAHPPPATTLWWRWPLVASCYGRWQWGPARVSSPQGMGTACLEGD